MKKGFMKKLSLLLAVAVFVTSIAFGWSTKAEAATTRTKTISIYDGSQITVLKGGYYTFAPKITPANSTDYLRYVSSDPSVVQVNLYTGKMKAIKSGTATVTVISKATKATKNSDKANVKDSVVVKVVSNYATTNSWAKTLITSPSSGTVKISTKKAVKITTPTGNFDNKYLVANLPYGDLVNNGVFKSVSVYDVKDNTYYENAKGNTIHLFDKNTRLVVTDKASVKALNVKANNGTLKLIANGPVQALTVSGANNAINLVANSTLGTVNLNAKTDLTILGKTGSVEVTLAAGAEGSTITNNLNEGATLKVTNNTAGVVTVTNANGVKTEVKAGETTSVATDVTPTPAPTTTPGTGSGSSSGGNSGSTTAYKTVTASVSGETATYTLPVSFDKLVSAVVKVEGVDNYTVSGKVINYVAALLDKESHYIDLWEGLESFETTGYTVNGSTIKVEGKGLTKDVTFDGVTYVVTLNKEDSSVTLQKKDGKNTYTLSKEGTNVLKIQSTDAPANLSKVSFYVGY